MSEEVTYATLTFQDSAVAGNNRNGNNLRKRGYPAPSPIWRQAALCLLILCLMLLIGLVTLGIMFLQTSNEISSDSEKLSQLQKIIHQQQFNSSQQLDNYKNFPMEEKFLKSQIADLLKRQGQMSIKLCQELIIRISDHKCNPCPRTWHWYQNSCYYFTTNEEKTWINSRKDCKDKNSTLVKIDNLEEKDFLKSQPLPKFSFFWLGLSWDPSARSWLWEDGSIPSPSLCEPSPQGDFHRSWPFQPYLMKYGEGACSAGLMADAEPLRHYSCQIHGGGLLRFNTKEHAQINGSKKCAYLQRGNIYISRCSAEIFWICEKTAALVEIEDLD